MADERRTAGRVPSLMYTRTTLPDGSIRLEGERCAFTFTRLRPGVLWMGIEGFDRGEFLNVSIDEVGAELSRFQPFTLFIDFTRTDGATSNVRDAWTAWFTSHKQQIARVHALVRTTFLQQMISVAKVLSHTGEMIRIYTDPAKFIETAGQLVPGFEPPSHLVAVRAGELPAGGLN